METEQYIGVDLHKAFFQACAITTKGERLWEGRFMRTAEDITRFVDRCGAQAAVAVEATTPTWHFVDQIAERVGHVCVVDTRKTKLKAGYAAKTDRLDARRLADALRRESVVSIYIPSPAIRELRELCRHRLLLTQMRTRVLQRTRALLLRQGLGDPPAKRLRSRAGQVWLDQLVLPAQAHRALTTMRQLDRDLTAQLGPVESDIAREALADPIVRRLQTCLALAPSWASCSARKSATSAAFRRRRTWRVMRAWSRRSTAVRAGPITAGSRKTDRRGCDGPWSKSASRRYAAAIHSGAGDASWRCAKGP